MNTYQLIYQSQSLVPFDVPELTALLVQARAYNHAHDITGLLLYTPDGRFLQVLEGERAAVRHLYFDRIAADPRHSSCLVLGEGYCAHRSFTTWSMGFRVAQASDLRVLLGYVPPCGLALRVPRPHTPPELVALLLDFVAAGQPADWLEHPR